MYNSSRCPAIDKVSIHSTGRGAAIAAPPVYVEVLDVYELDRAAGFFEGEHDDFHVSPKQSTHAALAVLLQLRLKREDRQRIGARAV